MGPTVGLGTLLFETSLRSNEKKAPDLIVKEKNWSTIPKKERKGFLTAIFEYFLMFFKNFHAFCQNLKKN